VSASEGKRLLQRYVRWQAMVEGMRLSVSMLRRRETQNNRDMARSSLSPCHASRRAERRRPLACHAALLPQSARCLACFPLFF